MTLLEAHRQHLRGSGLRDETIGAAGIYSVEDPAAAARILNRKDSDCPVPAIAFPVFGFDGSVVQTILRPDSPRTRDDGSVAKYEQPVGERHRVWFPPSDLVAHARLVDPKQPLILVEGIKKALAAIHAGGVAISMQGVWVWHDAGYRSAHEGRPDEWRLHSDLAPLSLAGRRVYVGFDGGDTTGNPSVILAEARLARLLLDVKADPRLIRIPFKPCGPKIGLDDYLAEFAQ